MIPQYQIVAEEVEDLGDGLIKVTADGNQYKPEFEAAVAVGNFICIEVTHSLQRAKNPPGSSLPLQKQACMKDLCKIRGD